jgi:hypothetical protein
VWLATGDIVEGGDFSTWYVLVLRASLFLTLQLLTPFRLGKHRDLQRVTVPYAKLLDMVDTTSEHGDAMDL